MPQRSKRDSELANRRIKVLAVASGGGHWVQLLRLAPAWADCDVSFATVHSYSAADVPGHRLFTFTDASRKNVWKFPLVALQMLWIVLRVWPQVVITTGAAPPLLALLFGRLIGARTLWVDSIANSEILSSSGVLAGKIAHQTVTQWPDLAQGDRPACWGAVL